MNWNVPPLTFCIVVSLVQTVFARIVCTSEKQCEDALLPRSDCGSDGYCTNPFTVGGCLENLLPEDHPSAYKKVRVCNSEDDEMTARSGHCRRPNHEFEHMEIRILAQNWESSYIMTCPLDYGISNDWNAFTTANRVVDCRLSGQGNQEGGYESCAHIVPEVWETRLARVQEMILSHGTFEPPTPVGVLGTGGWFVPRRVGLHDPTVMSYLGFQGEENRRKVAEMFLWPTTFAEYCSLVSKSNCTADDGMAKRPPKDETEGASFFVENVYTGHFRKTEKNDCDLNPTTCVGHFADYPCDWKSFSIPQIHHLGLNLEPKQYTYAQLTEIIEAANATESYFITQWWRPQILEQSFVGTDSAFLKVDLPAPTQECIEHRIATEGRCSEDPEKRYGHPLGACDIETQILSKVIARSLYDATNDPRIPEARRSPAHEAIKLFEISTVQLGQIIKDGFPGDTARWNHDPRMATCQWVVNNIEHIGNHFLPRSYPRVLEELQRRTPLYYASLAVGAIAAAMTLLSVVITHRNRRTPAIKYAQIEFLTILQIGLMAISAGSITMVLDPTVGACIASVWLVNLGYTLELVPLIVKVAALNHPMKAARKMKRVVIPRKRLFGFVVVLSFLSVVFLTCWTIVDTTSKVAEHELTDEVTEDGETVVALSYRCDNGARYWRGVSISVLFIYLIVATVLAVQTRKLQVVFNESQTVAMMIYSHAMFAVFRLVTYFLDEAHLASATSAGIRSLTLSCDVIATIVIYFLPKFVTKHDPSKMVRQSKVDIVATMLTRVTDLAEHDDDDFNGTSSSGAVSFASLTGWDRLKKSTGPPDDFENEGAPSYAFGGHLCRQCRERIRTDDDEDTDLPPVPTGANDDCDQDRHASVFTA
ncbi:expressed unknown protein [Seminavis robusta]|uniref:G-protein coupled receptors family 3 profile domain-containing protein n=1 Tax=Seminavis robusta TaxID=568900 RepID=A0A9N8EEU7_9STRA|nr:expressed unknown protein [Seminavis robusta]|eukprot:Sro839_g209320.1 n/a (876) ;mRNA; r:35968-38771